MPSRGATPRVAVVGSAKSAWALHVAQEIELLFPNISPQVRESPAEWQDFDVVILTGGRGPDSAHSDCRVVWFFETYNGVAEDPPCQPDVVLCRSPKDVSDIASLAWGMDGVHVTLMPPAAGTEALGDADRFRGAIDGRFEIALTANAHLTEFASIIERVRAQRPGCFFGALDGDRVLKVDPDSTMTPMEGVSACDALAATRVVFCANSDVTGMARAWHHWRPTLVHGNDRVLSSLSEASGGGLWYLDHSLEAPADFLLQHPQIGNVIGAQGRRWIEHHGNRTALAARWASALGSAL